MSKDIYDSIHINHQITLSPPKDIAATERDFNGISREQFYKLDPELRNLLLDALNEIS